MSQEIERKFLIKTLPPRLRRQRHDDIRQGYLAWDKGTEVRIRRRGSKHVLTVKRGSDSSTRQEVEVALPAKSFAKLWPLTAGMRVKKRRYKNKWAGRTIELDVYRGKLRGLAVAEVEFPSVAAAKRFKPPDWFGKEITGQSQFSNRVLAARNKPPAGTTHVA